MLDISKAEFDIPSLCGMQTGRKRLLQHFSGAAVIRPVREVLDFCPNCSEKPCRVGAGAQGSGVGVNSGLHAC